MNYHDKTKDELIDDLKKLQHKYDSVKTSYEKEICYQPSFMPQIFCAVLYRLRYDSKYARTVLS